MTTYINDYNNMEDITNDLTKLNTTNVSNLTYKVDELQEMVAALDKYEHKTIIANSKDSWASKPWLSAKGGTYANDTTNYYQNGQSAKVTFAAEDDGMHLEKVMDLTAHSDGFTSTTDDIITIWLYIDSTSLTRINTPPCEVSIYFHMDAYDTKNNAWYIQPITEQISAGVNVLRYKKSEFTELGAGDWSNVKGVSIQLEDDDPTDTASLSIDSIIMHGKEYDRYVIKDADEVVNNSAVLQNDDELVVTLPPNGLFEIEVYLAVDANSDTSDLIIDYTTTGDVTEHETAARAYHGRGTNSTSLSNSGATNSQWTSSFGTDVNYGLDASGWALVMEKLIAETFDQGGTLQLRWCQANAEANDTVMKAGSYMKVNIIK
jgi:hypothetical protein